MRSFGPTPHPALSPRTSRVRENGLLSPALSSRGGEGDALRLLGACYKQVTPNGVCCGSRVQSAKFDFGEISPNPLLLRKRGRWREMRSSWLSRAINRPLLA